MQCPTHPEIHVPTGRICIMCSRENHAAWVKSFKTAKVEAKAKKKTSSGGLANLRKELQKVVRDKFYPYYFERGHCVRCWQCGNNLYGKGQIAHYFPKSVDYMLWARIENCGVACYNCNLNESYNVVAMEDHMRLVWGNEAIDKLKADQREYSLKIKTGQLKRWPDEMWLRAMILETRQMIITR